MTPAPASGRSAGQVDAVLPRGPTALLSLMQREEEQRIQCDWHLFFALI